MTILSRNKDVVAATEDIGLRGIFIRTEAPPAKMQLLRLKVALPGGAELVLHGVGKHVVDKSSKAHAAGIGIEFFGLDGTARKQWEEFVHAVSRTPGAFLPPPEPMHASELGELTLSDDDLEEIPESVQELGDMDIEIVSVTAA